MDLRIGKSETRARGKRSVAISGLHPAYRGACHHGASAIALVAGHAIARAHAGYLLKVLRGYQDGVATRTCHSNGFDDPSRDDCPARTCPHLPAPRPTIRAIPFACRSTRAASRTSISSAAIKRWRSVPRRPRAAPPNAWSIHITAGRRPSLASVSGHSSTENRALRRPRYPLGRRPLRRFTSRRCRARAASMGPPWRFASCRASGSVGLLRSRRRSRLCRGPTARRRTHCIAPRSSARQDTKFDATHRTVHPQIRRLMFQDTAPAHISNVNPCDSPLHNE